MDIQNEFKRYPSWGTADLQGNRLVYLQHRVNWAVAQTARKVSSPTWNLELPSPPPLEI